MILQGVCRQQLKPRRHHECRIMCMHGKRPQLVRTGRPSPSEHSPFAQYRYRWSCKSSTHHTQNHRQVSKARSSPAPGCKTAAASLLWEASVRIQHKGENHGKPRGRHRHAAAQEKSLQRNWGRAFTWRASLSQKACLSPQHIQQRSCQFIVANLRQHAPATSSQIGLGSIQHRCTRWVLGRELRVLTALFQQQDGALSSRRGSSHLCMTQLRALSGRKGEIRTFL